MPGRFTRPRQCLRRMIRVPGSARHFLPIPPRIGCRSPARLAGFGKRRLPTGCTMASMMPTAPQARERRRPRGRSADGLEARRGRGAAPSASSAPGTSLNDISLAAPGAVALRRMANLLARYAPHDGVFPLRLAGDLCAAPCPDDVRARPRHARAVRCASWRRGPRS